MRKLLGRTVVRWIQNVKSSLIFEKVFLINLIHNYLERVTLQN